ncbi:MAG: hypothetical protein KGJ60_05495 [Verrucomicrobiota bacterium]|nr:hypothetical protein [Verrucomicrobiota bacterium]
MKSHPKPSRLENVPGATTLAAAVPAPLLACAVCGGAHSESQLAHGMNAGIFTLMGVIVTVLAGIALFFVHIVRKEESAAPPPSPDRPADL